MCYFIFNFIFVDHLYENYVLDMPSLNYVKELAMTHLQSEAEMDPNFTRCPGESSIMEVTNKLSYECKPEGAHYFSYTDLLCAFY